MTDTPNPVGRPSKYEPSCCDRIVELCGQGKSLSQVANAFGVARQTLDNWADAHPEFMEALSRAKTAEQAWWEDAGQQGLFLDKFNAAVWKKSVEARFRDDYTERKQTELSGIAGGPIEITKIERVIVKPPNPDSGSVPPAAPASPL